MNPKLSGTIETIRFDGSQHTGRTIELVFRTVGERTSSKALELAIKHIRPNKVHIIKDCIPFTHTVERMLRISHACSHVVYVDADCLILKDMRPFLDANELPFVDAYVMDRFRGKVTCGVHIVRSDVVRKMQQYIGRFHNQVAYLLRPESFIRNIALAELGYTIQLKHFDILHDYLQFHSDIFAKYVIRYLRCAHDGEDCLLTATEEDLSSREEVIVAKSALHFISQTYTQNLKTETIQSILSQLPSIAKREVSKLTLTEQSKDILSEEFDTVLRKTVFNFPVREKYKVFGIGLSRTGTNSLTEALHELGFDTVHFPTDVKTLHTLDLNDATFPLLDQYDGITDITTVPYYKKLDTLYPGSKFILTVRNETSWLRSCHDHWNKEKNRTVQINTDMKQSVTEMEIKRVLRKKVYGTQNFDAPQFLTTYRDHLADVTEYFKNRKDDLLILNIISGDGYEQLAAFLKTTKPNRSFPHKSVSEAKMKRWQERHKRNEQIIALDTVKHP